MGYTDKVKQREYQRAWMRKRREEWFSDKSCVKCGKTDKLHLHHLDPSKKATHRIWSWSEERRLKEIAKCVTLCEDCHYSLHGRELRRHGIGRYQAGCRCETCRKAKSEAMKRETRRRKRQCPDCKGIGCYGDVGQFLCKYCKGTGKI